MPRCFIITSEALDTGFKSVGRCGHASPLTAATSPEGSLELAVRSMTGVATIAMGAAKPDQPATPVD